MMEVPDTLRLLGAPPSSLLRATTTTRSGEAYFLIKDDASSAEDRLGSIIAVRRRFCGCDRKFSGGYSPYLLVGQMKGQ